MQTPDSTQPEPADPGMQAGPGVLVTPDADPTIGEPGDFAGITGAPRPTQGPTQASMGASMRVSGLPQGKQGMLPSERTGAQALAKQRQYGAQAAQAHQQAGAAAKQAADIRAQSADDQLREGMLAEIGVMEYQRKRDEEFNRLMEEREKNLSMFTELSANIKPSERLMQQKQRSQIAGIIAAGFGAMAASFTGGPNALAPIVGRVWDSIDKEIQRDIEAQKREVGGFRAKADALTQEAGLRRQFYQDAISGELQEYELRTQAIAKEMEAKAQTAEGEAKQAYYRGIAASAQGQADLAGAKIKQQAQMHAERLGAQSAMTAVRASMQKAQKPELGFNPDQFRVKQGRQFTGTPTEAAALRDSASGTQMLMQQVAKAKGMMKDFSLVDRLSPNSEKRAALEAQEAAMLTEIKDSIVQAGAALNAAEMKLIMDQIGELTSLRQTKQFGRLNQLVNNLLLRIKTKAESRNLDLGPMFMRPDTMRTGTAPQRRPL